MRRLFNLFIKEKGINLKEWAETKLFNPFESLSLQFNKWLYQINKETGKRRFFSKDRVNKFMIRKWVEKSHCAKGTVTSIDYNPTITSVNG